jgi:hypothetical protein
MEIDEDLGWNANHSGSYLTELQPLNEKGPHAKDVP